MDHPKCWRVAPWVRCRSCKRLARRARVLLVRGTWGDCEYSLGNQLDANLVTILEVPGAEMGGAEAEGKLGERRRGDMVEKGGCEQWEEED